MECIAHRGSALRVPENSLAGIKYTAMQLLGSMLLSGSAHSKIHFTEKQDLNILPLDQVSRPLPLFATFQIPTSYANRILDDVIGFDIHHLKLIEARKELCPVAIGIPAIDCDESVSTKLD